MKTTKDIFEAELAEMPRAKRTQLSQYSLDEIFSVLFKARAEKALAQYIEYVGDTLFALQDLQLHYEKKGMADHALVVKDAFTEVEGFYDQALEMMTKEWDNAYAFIKKSVRKINSL